MQQDLDTLGREAERIVRGMGIPPCPAVLAKLVQRMRDDEPDFVEIGKLISSDVGLSAGILQTVNSPFFGLRTKATSVQQALTLLGLSNVAQLVTGLLLRQAFPAGANARLEQFWEISSCVALINVCVARKFSSVDRDAAYTFALFRDCGIPVMIGKFRDYVPSHATSRRRGGESVIDAETARHGTNHAVIGYFLAKSWLLPEETCQAILRHHDYSALGDEQGGVSPVGRKFIALALVSEWLFAQCTMAIDCSEWDVAGPAALEELQISPAILNDVLPEICQELDANRRSGFR